MLCAGPSARAEEEYASRKRPFCVLRSRAPVLHSSMHDTLRYAITEALGALAIECTDFTVEHPADPRYGDYASNVALVAAKDAGKAPREVAAQVRDALEGQVEYVEKIEVAGPGFLNFYLVRDFFQKEVDRAISARAVWGTTDALTGQRVLVEYTDPNPFKEFHIGHLFTNSVGESIARLFMCAGAEVKRINYQGDVGMHVACAIYGMQELGFAGARDFTATELGRAYALGATAYKDDAQAAERIRAINRAVYERNDEVISALYDKGRDVSLTYFETIYAQIGTQFDHYFFESDAAPRGKELVLAHPDVFPESDGARIFRGEDHGLHTRVFVNSEGLPTYEAKELALAKMKEEVCGEYDLSVIATSNEITEYFKVLKKALSAIYPELAERTEHIGHGTVRLTTGKMSSRTGEIVAATDFIREVADRAAEKIRASGFTSPSEELADVIAVGAIKYATLKSNILQDSVFDTEQSLSFEGDSGPYLQYTHARIVSVLKKAAAVGVTPGTQHAPSAPFEVERSVYQFPEVVARAQNERAPHYVAHYLTELAGAFNAFYATEKIADPEDEFAPYKAAVADSVRVSLKNGLWILGIEAPDHM